MKLQNVEAGEVVVAMVVAASMLEASNQGFSIKMAAEPSRCRHYLALTLTHWQGVAVAVILGIIFKYFWNFFAGEQANLITALRQQPNQVVGCWWKFVEPFPYELDKQEHEQQQTHPTNI